MSDPAQPFALESVVFDLDALLGAILELLHSDELTAQEDLPIVRARTLLRVAIRSVAQIADQIE